MAQNHDFHDFWLSIARHVYALGPYVFGSFERMSWSVSSPNMVVRYLILKKGPGYLDSSYFGRKFDWFFENKCHLVNTKVNKCWPKYFFRKVHIKSYKKPIYSFFIALVLFSQSLKVCLSLLTHPLLNLTFIYFWLKF